MKIRARFLYGLGILAVLFIAAPAFAAPVDGKWTGMFDSPFGNITLTYTFKAEGNVLAGSSTGPDGSQIPIKGGKIDGDKISFSQDLDFGGMVLTLDYKGVVSADQIKLGWEVAGMPVEVVLKKAP